MGHPAAGLHEEGEISAEAWKIEGIQGGVGTELYSGASQPGWPPQH